MLLINLLPVNNICHFFLNSNSTPELLRFPNVSPLSIYSPKCKQVLNANMYLSLDYAVCFYTTTQTNFIHMYVLYTLEHVRFAADTILHINITSIPLCYVASSSSYTPHISYNFQQNIVTSAAVHKVQIVYGITLSHFSHKYKAKQSAAVGAGCTLFLSNKYM